MNTKIVNFIKAFQSLSDSDKAEVLNIIKMLDEAEPINESKLLESIGMESITTINFAPAPGRCPTCGK